MEKEDIKFLIDLQKELLTQDNYGTRNPIWCIMDKEWVSKPDGYGDEYRVICFDEGICKMSDFANDMIDNYKLKKGKKATEAKEAIIECTDTEELRDVILKYFFDADPEDFKIVEGVSEEFICRDATGFITKKSAEEHLKENYHHYSHNAKTYALSAWRNPIYEKLIEIIKTTNWNDLNDNNLNK